MEKHINLLGIFFIIFGCMGLTAGILALSVLMGIGLLGCSTGNEFGLVLLSGTLSAIMTLIVLISSVPQIVAGIGLLKFKPWARVLGLIVGIISIPAFPFGTALGIYAVWVLGNNKTAPLFRKEAVSTL